MRSLFVVCLFCLCAAVAHSQALLTYDLGFPSIKADNSHAAITCTYGEIHGTGSPHIHAGVDFSRRDTDAHDAKMHTVHEGFMTFLSDIDGNPNISSVVISYYDNGGIDDDPEDLFFRTRYMHQKLFSTSETMQNHWLPAGTTCFRPKEKSEQDDGFAKYDAHLHLELFDWTGTSAHPTGYANILYNYMLYVWNPFTGQVLDEVICDMYHQAVNGPVNQFRISDPIHDNSTDTFRPKIRGVDWQSTRHNNSNTTVVTGNLGPVLGCGDTGINVAQANTLSVFEAFSYIRKTGTTNWTTQFGVVCAEVTSNDKEEANSRKVFRYPEAPVTRDRDKYGNNDWLYMYKNYAGASHSFHGFGTGNYSGLPEGKIQYRFRVNGYENDYTTSISLAVEHTTETVTLASGEVLDYNQNEETTGTVFNGPYAAQNFYLVVDNNPNPTIQRIIAYQKRPAGSDFAWTKVYEWNQGTVVQNDDLYSGSNTKLVMQFSEDASVAQTTKIHLGSSDFFPLSKQADPDNGAVFGNFASAPEVSERYWEVVLPPTQAAGDATLNLQATDLGDNSVPNPSVTLHYILKAGAQAWDRYL